MRRASAIVAAVLLAAGLGVLAARSGVGSSPSSPPGNHPAAAVPATLTAPGCPDATDPVAAVTIEEQRAAIVGVWVRCSPTGVLPSAWGATEDGLELTADGRWYRLTHTGETTLVRQLGGGDQGTYALYDRSGTGSTTMQDAQLDFTNLSGWTQTAMVTAYASPPVLSMSDTMNPQRSGYTRWDGAPPTDAPPPAVAPGCPGAAAPASPTTPDDAVRALAGTWIRCSPGGFLPSGWGAAEAGLELTADGRWYRLYRGSDGMPVRGSGRFDAGTVDVQLPGGTALIVGFQAADAGAPATGTLFTSPRVLVLSAAYLPSQVGAYTAWDGRPLPGGTPGDSTSHLPPVL